MKNRYQEDYLFNVAIRHAMRLRYVSLDPSGNVNASHKLYHSLHARALRL